MPRQNRVNPFGELITTASHGLFMGNRGVLHDDQGLLTEKRWTHTHWIICLTVDKILQDERVKSDSKVATYMDRLDALPQGTFVSLQKAPGQAFLLWYGVLWQWSSDGYIEGPKVSSTAKVVVLTPASTVNALKAGYQPVVALNKVAA